MNPKPIENRDGLPLLPIKILRVRVIFEPDNTSQRAGLSPTARLSRRPRKSDSLPLMTPENHPRSSSILLLNHGLVPCRPSTGLPNVPPPSRLISHHFQPWQGSPKLHDGIQDHAEPSLPSSNHIRRRARNRDQLSLKPLFPFCT